MNSPDHGRFCWYDLMSTQPSGSLNFYADLLGWTIKNVPMNGRSYGMLHAGETPLGGIVPLDPEQKIPTHWIPYVRVDDIEASCDLINRHGGGVCVPPTDLGLGEFAVVNDPQGGYFSIRQAGGPLDSGPDESVSQVVGWNECLSTDAAASAAFYEKIFGWRYKLQAMNVGGQDLATYLLYQDGRPHAGIMDLPPPALELGTATHWLSYANVDNVDAAAEKAASMGALVLCPCTDIAETGRFCVIQDPQGGVLSLFTPAS